MCAIMFRASGHALACRGKHLFPIDFEKQRKRFCYFIKLTVIFTLVLYHPTYLIRFTVIFTLLLLSHFLTQLVFSHL